MPQDVAMPRVMEPRLQFPLCPNPRLPPQHIANQLLLRTRERELLFDNLAALGQVEELLDVVRAPEAGGGDTLPVDDSGCKLLGRALKLQQRRGQIAAALALLFGGDAAATMGGWTSATVAAACIGGRVKIFSRATLGTGSGEVFSVAYGRQRTRNSNHVKVRWEENGRTVPYICAVEYFVLVEPPQRGGPRGGGSDLDGGLAMRPLRVALVKAYAAQKLAPGLWKADAGSAVRPPGARSSTALWPVLLEHIDRKVLVASPGRDVSHGALFGIEYTTLSRIS